MILSGRAIQREIDEGNLTISDPEIKEASVKIHLSGLFGENKDNFTRFKSYLLKAKSFVLAKTREQVELSENLAGLYDNHLHLSRDGIFTHLGSMLIEPGFKGQFTLEIFNASDNDYLLEKDMRAGNLMIVRVGQ